MNLQATVSLYGGGPGSGCNPRVGKCGRKKGSVRKAPKVGTKAEVSKYIDTPKSKKPLYTKMNFDEDYKVLEEDASLHTGIVLADGTGIIGTPFENHDRILSRYADEHGNEAILEIMEQAKDWNGGSSVYVDKTPDTVRWGWNKDMYVSVYMEIGPPTKISLGRVEKLVRSLASDHFEFEWGGSSYVEGERKDILRKIGILRRRLK